MQVNEMSKQGYSQLSLERPKAIGKRIEGSGELGFDDETLKA